MLRARYASWETARQEALATQVEELRAKQANLSAELNRAQTALRMASRHAAQQRVAFGPDFRVPTSTLVAEHPERLVPDQDTEMVPGQESEESEESELVPPPAPAPARAPPGARP